MKTKTEKEVKKAKINFSELKFIDLNGLDLTPVDFPKELSNLIFTNVDSVQMSIELDESLRALHKGAEVEITHIELRQIIGVVDELKPYKPWCQRIMMDYFKNKLKAI